jgi:MFS family permease
MTSNLTSAFACIVGLGVCAGAVYVLGFTILQETVEDEFRGRIFSALYTLVRLCLLLAFAVAPFLSRLLDEVSDDFIGRSVEILGFDVYLPGVRLTLLFSAALMVGAGFLALLSLRAGGRRRASLPA